MNLKIRRLLTIIAAVVVTGCSGGTFSSSGDLNNTKIASVPTTNLSLKQQGPEFITVTICQSGTNNCQAIDHIQVDYGSTGLRVNKSALALQDLSPVTFMKDQLYQCVQYASGYNFGPVVSADVKLSGGTAKNIPIQIISDLPTNSNVPQLCSQGLPYNNFSQFGAKGIIGINSNSRPDNNYTYVYSCDDHLACKHIFAPTVIQAELNINPVREFPTDGDIGIAE